MKGGAPPLIVAAWLVVGLLSACASQPVSEVAEPTRSPAATPSPASPAAPSGSEAAVEPSPAQPSPEKAAVAPAEPEPPKAPPTPSLPFEALRPEEIVSTAADAPETQSLVERVNGAWADFQACAVEHRKGDAFGVAIVELELEQTVLKREVKVGAAHAVRALATGPEVVRCVERIAQTISFEQPTSEEALVSRMSFRTFVFVGPKREVGALFRSFDALRVDKDTFRSCAGIDGRKIPEHRVELVGGQLSLAPRDASPKVLKGLKRHAKKLDACGQQTFGGWGERVGYLVIE